MLFLKTKERSEGFSKGELNKFRSRGMVPACIYGGGKDSRNVFVNSIEFKKVFSKEGKVFQLELGNEKLTINTKEIQRSPIKGTIIHISFLELKKGDKTTVSLPIKATGSAAGEKEGGLIQISYGFVKVDGVPSKIPSDIEVNVESLGLNDILCLKDIRLPEGITLGQDEDPMQTVITCKQPTQHAPEDLEEKEPVVIGEEKTEPTEAQDTEIPKAS